MTLHIGSTSLSQVRQARGLTLEDAEHSTRISRKFLIALEEHDYSVFPAPVYARGFLRTYCRYLGIDPEPQLAELPEGWTSAASTVTTAPPPRHVTAPTLNFNVAWLVAGAVVAAVIGAAVLMSRSGDNLGALQVENPAETQQQQQQATQSVGSTTGSSPSQPQSQSPAAAPTQTASQPVGRVLDPGLPGILPDFSAVAIDDVTAFLTQQSIPFLRIDTVSSEPAGLVIAQTPAPGASTANLEQVTLTVSTGATPTGATRTDCGVLAAANQRTAAEQAYFESNCGTPPAPPADRTTCGEIRGTDYRSPAERQFFLANCILQ